jgi:hypothetical protein
VAERIFEYHELGIDEFILSGHPHLEEAYAVGEGVLPRVTGAVEGRRRIERPAAGWDDRHQTLEPTSVR